MKRAAYLVVAVVAVLSLLGSGSGHAVTLNSGDILVVDFQGYPPYYPASTVPAAVYRVDPVTGAQTTITSDLNLIDPTGIVYTPSCELFVTDETSDKIVRVDPDTGTQTVVTQFPVNNLFAMRPIVHHPNGYLYVADYHGAVPGTPYQGWIYRIDPSLPPGSNWTRVESGLNGGADPFGLAVDPLTGDLLIADANSLGNSPGQGRVWRLRLTSSTAGTFDPTPVATNLNDPEGIIVASNGDVYFTDYNGGLPGLVMKVDHATGVTSTISSGGLLVDPSGIAVAENGDLIVVDLSTGAGATGAVLRIDATTGAQSVISQGGNFLDPFAIAIVPNLEPTITPPADVAVSTAPGATTCDAFVSDTALGSVVAAPHCPGAVTITHSGVPPGNLFPLGTTVVTWTATDAEGRVSAPVSQAVTVTDGTPPTIMAPDGLSLGTDPGGCTRNGATVNLGVVTAADNCGGVTVSNDAPATFPKGPTTVTWTATDAAGNTATASQVVTILDTEMPTIAAPPPLERPANGSTDCALVLSAAELGLATASDNCPGVTVAASDIPAGNLFPVGTTVVTWTATDAAGNSASAGQSVTVVDTTPPAITAPADVTMTAATFPVPAASVSLGTPVTSDNCAVASVTNDAPASYAAGVTSVTWTVTDTHGNDNTATQTVTLQSVATSATIEVVSALHTVGAGDRPGSSKAPLGLALKVFDKAVVGSSSPQTFASIWNSSTAPVLPLGVAISGPSQIAIGNGMANQYSVQVPAGGSYVVIGQASVGSAIVYVGSPTDLLAAASTTHKFLQVIQQANGKIVAAKTTEVPGSLLLVTEPEFIEFTGTEELYPIVYESVEGDWNVIVHADPPEGFVSSPGTLQAEVQTDELRALQFTIIDVGSDWTETRVSHRLRHKGRDRTVVTEAKMVNRQKGRPAKADPGAQEPAAAALPTTYALRQNRPDPFNPRTTIEFDLPEAADVTLRVYDVLGRKVAALLERRSHAPGRHQVVFDGSGLPSGVYLYRLQAGSFTSTRRMLLLK